MSNILNDFFNPTVKPNDAYASASNNQEFRPNPKKGQNGVYEAVVRFLPNPVDPANKSMIQKFTAYIQDPRNGTKHALDDPRTIGQQSIIANTFFALRESANPILKENAKQFSSKLSIYSLIQVLSCKSDPSIEGKILVWRYGQKILEKINAEMNPPMGEGHNPFNLILGRPFALKVKEVSGFPNYDACAFFDLALNQSGFRIQVPDAMGNLQWMVVTNETIASEQGRTAVFEYLKNNAPDMTAYEYKPWTQEDQNFINEMVQIYSNPQAIAAAVQTSMMSGAPAAPSTGGFVPNQSSAPAMGINNNMFAGIPTPAAAPAVSMPNTSAPTGFNMGSAPGVGMNMGSAPTAPSMGMAMPQNTTPGAAPGGFNTTGLPGDIDAVIGGGTPTPTPAAAPTTGLNLDEILAGQMMAE